MNINYQIFLKNSNFTDRLKIYLKFVNACGGKNFCVDFVHVLKKSTEYICKYLNNLRLL